MACQRVRQRLDVGEKRPGRAYQPAAAARERGGQRTALGRDAARPRFALRRGGRRRLPRRLLPRLRALGKGDRRAEADAHRFSRSEKRGARAPARRRGGPDDLLAARDRDRRTERRGGALRVFRRRFPRGESGELFPRAALPRVRERPSALPLRLGGGRHAAVLYGGKERGAGLRRVRRRDAARALRPAGSEDGACRRARGAGEEKGALLAALQRQKARTLYERLVPRAGPRASGGAHEPVSERRRDRLSRSAAGRGEHPARRRRQRARAHSRRLPASVRRGRRDALVACAPGGRPRRAHALQRRSAVAVLGAGRVCGGDGRPHALRRADALARLAAARRERKGPL